MESKQAGGPHDAYQPAAPPMYTFQQEYPPQQGYPPQHGYQPQDSAYPPPTSQGFIVGPPPPVSIYPPLSPTDPKSYPPPPTYTPQPAPTVGRAVACGPAPMTVVCPSCGAEVLTKVRYESSAKTHIFAALLCIFGCIPCACIPYCVDSCQNGNHYCPNCQCYLGTYKS